MDGLNVLLIINQFQEKKFCNDRLGLLFLDFSCSGPVYSKGWSSCAKPKEF